MGDHINTKKNTQKRHKSGFSESRDTVIERLGRVRFKHYIQDLEEALLEEEMSLSDDTTEE